MKFLVVAVLIITTPAAYGQYYYRDILSAKEAQSLAQAYVKSGVSSVLVNSYDANNQRISDLTIRQQFDMNRRTLVTTSGSITGASVLTSVFDDQNKIIFSVDSSNYSVGKTMYEYDVAGRLVRLAINSNDSSKSFQAAEEHLWKYNEAGKPVRMIKVKNKVDSTTVTFMLDERGNVIEEQEMRRGVKSNPVYYYYNDQNLLTDIVRYNDKAGRLIPEYLFEYDSKGNLIQKITVPANSGDYLIWRYMWDENGLKTREAIYNKQKQLSGKVEYQYGFSNPR